MAFKPLAKPTAAVRESMRSNSSSETQPEVKLRQALWAAGLRGYRKNYKRLPGKPDIVFVGAKVCVFVHGCFWHQCPRCRERRNLKPTQNGAFWSDKFARSVERDAQNVSTLEQSGWTVILVWECEIKDDLSACVKRIQALLTQQGSVRIG